MTAAEVLRVALAAQRERGASFDAAWLLAMPHAVTHAEDDEWPRILEGMRATWRAAYERRPALAAAGRSCEWCGAAIDHRRPIARFCDSACYNAARRARRREELGTPNRCENCGAPIVGRRADTRACSTACAHKLLYVARRASEGKPPPLENCVICGGSLAHRNADAQVCGRKCARVRARQRYRELAVEPVAA